MALYQTPQATGRQSVQIVNEHNVVPLVYEFTSTATEVTDADIVELGELAPYGTVVDWIMTSDALDTASAITVTMGVLNAGKTDVATAWVTASTIARTGGGVARMATPAPARLAVSESAPPVLGFKLGADATTWGGAGKKLTLTVFVRPTL